MEIAPPLVTIGVTTFRRPLTLRRAVTSALSQNWPRVEVLVSNDDPDWHIDHSQLGVRTDETRLKIHNQSSTLGMAGNYRFLTERAAGDFFMFLNDDDWVSPDFVEILTTYLIDHPECVSVQGRWILISPDREIEGKQRDYIGDWAKRTATFMLAGNDASFHGVHRTHALQATSMAAFRWYPDRLTHLCYPTVFSMVDIGSVQALDYCGATFYNSIEAPKHYTAASKLQVLIRRFELNLIFINIARRSHGLLGVAWVSAIAVVREVKWSTDTAWRVLRRYAARHSFWKMG